MRSAQLAEAEEDDAGAANEFEIWGDRATSLLEAMGVMSRPIKKGTLAAFANRKGWEMPTLEGLLAYCARTKQLEAYRGFNGQPCFRLAGEKDQPPPEDEEDEEDEPDEEELPAAAGAVRAQRQSPPGARTAPAANYGCPEHGGARPTTTTEETTMAKEWITTAEAAELLGVSDKRVGVLARKHALEAKKDESYTGKGHKPFIVKRASVIAYRDRADSVAPKTATRKAPPPQQQAVAAKVSRRAPAAPSSTATGDLAEDVRALLRNVERGWMTTDAMLGHLRSLVG